MNRSLRLELAPHELLVMELTRSGYVSALSGRHWLSVAGLDIELAPGERAEIPAGKVLAEGGGVLEFSQPLAQGARKLWPLGRAAQTAWLGKVCF